MTLNGTLSGRQVGTTLQTLVYVNKREQKMNTASLQSVTREITGTILITCFNSAFSD